VSQAAVTRRGPWWRRPVLLAALVVVVWLAGAGPLGSFAGRLGEVQTNDNASFLPESAEATQVSELQRRFVEEEVLPVVVVYERAAGITDADLQTVAADVRAISTLDGIAGGASPPIPSKDGAAVQLIVPLRADLGDDTIGVVELIRAEVAAEGGLRSFVTGPGGLLADFVEVFEGIDGLLLLVAVIVVLVILLVVYRSPLLPFIVLVSALLALSTASALVYALADAGRITLNGQSQGILFILVVGAATDYALLLVSRFREELREQPSRFDAMRVAWRQSFPPILASGTTVILGVLCLLFSDLNSNQGLGPVAAIGIGCSLLVALTFLPAALALLGRAAFWPFRPRYGSPHGEETGVWGRVSRLVGRRPRAVWIGTAVVLVALAAFAPRLDSAGTSQADLFLTEVESVTGQRVLGDHFPAGAGSPAAIIGPADSLDQLTAAVGGAPGVSSVAPVGAGPPAPGQQPRIVDGLVQLDATLIDPADSQAAERTVQTLRRELDAVSQDALVGGPTAIQLDTREAAERDRTVILPIVLLVVLVVLVLLLRSVVAPLLLIATVVLSFAATLGVAALMFEYVFFGSPGTDPSVPLFAFVFLVALGIDYNIFLMTRVREESWRRGTRPGILRGLAVTGGVITSAGLVLAATFSALAVLPLAFLAQIAFLVGFGVLLDALVVRSLLVPALSYDIGRRIWWPSRLGAEPRSTPRHAANQPAPEPQPVAGS